MIKDELAYLAGFFDGEGCIKFVSSKKRSNKWIEICVTQTCMEPLTLYASEFGGKVYESKRKTTGGLLLYNFRSVKRDVVINLLTALYPYLIVKKSKAKLALLQLGVKIPKELKLPIEAYAAGFFDAEGCISIRYCGGNKVQPRMRITQIVEEPLRLIQAKFGGKVFKHREKTKKGSTRYEWYSGQSRIDEICEVFVEYAVVKLTQLTLLSQLIAIRLNNSGNDPRANEKLHLAQEIISANSGKSDKTQSKVLKLVV